MTVMIIWLNIIKYVLVLTCFYFTMSIAFIWQHSHVKVKIYM